MMCGGEDELHTYLGQPDSILGIWSVNVPCSLRKTAINFRTPVRSPGLLSSTSCLVLSAFSPRLCLLLCNQRTGSFTQNLGFPLHQPHFRWWQGLRNRNLIPLCDIIVCYPTLEVETSCSWQTAEKKVPAVLLSDIPWERGQKIA